MTTFATWRSRPVFISSTFRDMHAERDWLRIHVFPVLEERLRDRFHHLETVDLRWGVDSASAEQEQDREIAVLTVCLREIERSRPFLIGLLGDRYGWRPQGVRITAAAREAGLDADVAGKSVTELEILYGVLRSPDQQRRSWFYLRDPLPYDTMPPAVAARYSEAHSGELQAADNAQRLRALKGRLATALPGRVRTYSARWNAETQSVTGLQSWGALVLEDLWGDLEAETTVFLRDAPRTWQGQDRWALDEFIEGRMRGFVGRTGITNELIAFATSPPADGAPWGACVTAQAGGGKSSLFGHLYRSLHEKDVLVLAHAAGISVRSTQVDWILRRWVGELADALAQVDPLAEQASPDDIDQSFSRLLHLAAQTRRVVVLIDALNQFEPTTRATHLTWLRKPWPSNARLIATAIPGTQSGALLQRQSVVEKPLPPIDRDEGLNIVRRICARYHRTLNARVETALLDKGRHDGAPAFGNPLWLELATEELNLLGAEAFDRAGAPGAEGIVNLLVSVVEQMPADIERLYGWMLDRAERHFGQAWTRAFVNTIAVSRAGWRESDLEKLMPVLSGEAWDPLRLATLRRAFRAHVVQRGAHAQWDFAHAQMRIAIAQPLAREAEEKSTLHEAIADHLLSLPNKDPLHETETMVHLMQAATRTRAAVYYGSELTDGEIRGATGALAALVLQKGPSDVVSLLDQSVDPTHRGRVGERFLRELNDDLLHSAPLDVRGRLLQAASRAFSELAATDLRNAEWQRHLSGSRVAIGDVLRTQGNVTGALESYRASLAPVERLAMTDPGNVEWQRCLAVSHERIGVALEAQGNLPGALAAYQATHRIAKRLVAADPRDVRGQHDLAVSHREIGDLLGTQGNLAGALAEYQASLVLVEPLSADLPILAVIEDSLRPSSEALHALRWHKVWHKDDGESFLAAIHDSIGNVLRDQGNLPGALAAYQTSLGIRERFATGDPGNAGWQDALSVSHCLIGRVLTAQGNLPGALAAYQASLGIAERLAAADPGNAAWQRGLSVSHDSIGNLLMARGNLAGAVAEYQASLAIAEHLAADDPANAGWQSDLAVSHGRIGDVLSAQGTLAAALAAYQASLAIRERLAAINPGNAHWQDSLATGQREIGGAFMALGNLPGALTVYQASLAIARRLEAVDPANTLWQRDLAMSYHGIGDVLSAQGNLPGALEACQASLAIVERLTTADRGNLGWQRDLALGHHKIGNVLTVQGNLAAALAAYQAGLTINESLTAADPTNTDWQRDLAGSHNNIAIVLQSQGNAPGALAAYQASLTVFERLSAVDPNNAGWHRELAGRHRLIGDVLSAQANWAMPLAKDFGDRLSAMKFVTTALDQYQAGLAIVERFAAAEPGNVNWKRDLAVSHDKIGDVLTIADKKLPGALTAYRTSCQILEQLILAEPGNASWHRDLSVSHDKIGDVLTAQGNLPGALAAYQARLTIAERLAAADSGNAGWQHGLSASHIKIGEVVMAQGNLPGALAAYQASLVTCERLVAADPGNAGWHRDLSVSHIKIGDVLTAQGSRSGALAAYQASLAIAERLAATDPGNAGWQHDHSVSHVKIGEALTAQGNLPGALAAFQASLAIAERLAAADPGNAGWQRDLAVSHNHVGNVLTASRDLPGALTAYLTSLQTRERLAASDPGNAGWQRDLSVSRFEIGFKVGDVLTAGGNLPEALQWYQAILAIAERLAAADPGNGDWQHDHSLSHIKIGDVLTAQGSRSGALAAFQASLAIAERLAAADPDNADWQRDLVVSYFKLATHCSSTNDPGAADYWRRCHAVLRRMRAHGMFLDPSLVELLEQLDRGGVPRA